jgi:hypothetical protein
MEAHQPQLSVMRMANARLARCSPYAYARTETISSQKRKYPDVGW